MTEAMLEVVILPCSGPAFDGSCDRAHPGLPRFRVVSRGTAEGASTDSAGGLMR